MAILIPGFYHGGWNHLMTMLAFVNTDGQSANIKTLFPADNFHLWFYEITGSMEFVLAVLAAYYLYKAKLEQ